MNKLVLLSALLLATASAASSSSSDTDNYHKTVESALKDFACTKDSDCVATHDSDYCCATIKATESKSG